MGLLHGENVECRQEPPKEGYIVVELDLVTDQDRMSVPCTQAKRGPRLGDTASFSKRGGHKAEGTLLLSNFPRGGS